MTSDFLAIPDFTRPSSTGCSQLAERMRGGKYDKKPLAGKTLAMIFMKSSTRTRVSFEVGTFQLGGHALFLSARDVQLGRGEPIADTARVLSRYVDGIMIRTFAHQDVEELAKYADVPGHQRAHRSAASVPDPRRPAHGAISTSATSRARSTRGSATATTWRTRGSTPRIASASISTSRVPKATSRPITCSRARRKSPRFASFAIRWKRRRGAHVVNTDVWASMGQEQEQKERERAFTGLLGHAGADEGGRQDAIFLHCLPAHRGEEVSAEVIDGPQSRVWDEAENRLHIQKAIMAVLMGGEQL